MPLTLHKPLNAKTIKTDKFTETATKSTSHLTFLLRMLITLLVIVLDPTAAAAQAIDYSSATTTPVAADQYGLEQYLDTQIVLIDTLREYIKALEQKIDIIKCKTEQIKTINNVALTGVPKYVNNPLNALTMLKRFTSDWHILQEYAQNVNNTKEIVQNLTNTRKSLKFPNESDFDEAAGNLLRIQGIYQLQPEGLAMGEVNGVKLGSAMSWSDCLEIGRKSVQKGDFKIAKFWIEVALGKLPGEGTKSAIMSANASKETPTINGVGSSVIDKAHLEIMEALVTTEFRMGNIDDAFEIINKLLRQHPRSEFFRKVRAQMENELDKSTANSKDKKQKKKRSDKSVEESLIEETCRETANIAPANSTANNKVSHHIFNSRKQHCRLVDGNLPELLLQPFQVEFLSLDPYIAVHHNVLDMQEIDELQELIEEEYADDGVVLSESLKFTKLAQRKLRSLAKRLQLATGHASADIAEWLVERFTFEDVVHVDPLVPASTQTMANVLFSLQTPKLGGAIVFPQLELGILLPANALLYWTQLDEYYEYDYRSKQHVCPVIAGTQLTVYTSITARS